MHRQLIEDPMLSQCLILMGLSILPKCSILLTFRSSSSSNNHHPSHSKVNKVIKTLAFLVAHHHPKNICKISSRGHIPVVSMVAMEACKAFLPQKTHLHKHYSCSSSNGNSSRTHILRTKLANLSLKWGAKIAHQLLIVEFLVRI